MTANKPETAVQGCTFFLWGHTQFLFMEIFVQYYRENLTLVDIDEAHCILEWLELYYNKLYILQISILYRERGKFRKAYDGIMSLTRASFMALTESAPPATMKYIHESLSLISPITIMHNFKHQSIQVHTMTFETHSCVQTDFAVLGQLLINTDEAHAFPKTVIVYSRKNTVCSSNANVQSTSNVPCQFN